MWTLGRMFYEEEAARARAEIALVYERRWGVGWARGRVVAGNEVSLSLRPGFASGAAQEGCHLTWSEWDPSRCVWRADRGSESKAGDHNRERDGWQWVVWPRWGIGGEGREEVLGDTEGRAAGIG